MGGACAPTSRSSSSRTWSPPERGWRVTIALGAAAIALAILGFLHSGNVVYATAAYADVRRAMSNVAAVSWIETQSRYDPEGRLTLRNTHHIWVRKSPPAIAEEDSASTVPQIKGGEYAGAARVLSDAHGQIRYDIRDHVYYLHPPADIVREVQSAVDSLTAREMASGPIQKSFTTLHGHPAILFTQPVHFHASPDQKARIAFDGEDKVWADPQTLRVLRRRSDLAYAPYCVPNSRLIPVTISAQRIIVDATEFVYNTPTPTGIFDLRPPKNAHVTEDDGKGNKTVVISAASRSESRSDSNGK